MGINSSLDHEKKHTLALSQGDTYSLALNEMQEEDVHATTQVDDYIISLACENAEGMYMFTDKGKQEWMIPASDENLHVEIVVQDKDDKRFIPHLEVQVQLIAEDGTKEEPFILPFVWHPFLFHYGKNTTLPHGGTYTVAVSIKKPTFHLHDETYGKRYQKDVAVILGPIKLIPGRKEHGEE